MAKFIIDVNSVSDTDVRTNLEDFLASAPDADKWSQFFQASSGQLTVEMVVGLATYLKYDSISSRRENYLPYAQTRGGVVAGGQQLGYSTNRGRNAILSISFIPTTTGTLPKWHILGDVNGFPLILLNETIVNTGVPITVSATIGDIINQEIQSTTDKASTFRFTEKRVSEEAQVFIDGNLISSSNDVLDMLTDKFFLQTNALGSVDAKYLNQDSATTKYLNGSIIKLEWVELNDITFTESDVVLDITDGTLTGVVVDSLFDSFETNDSVRVNAPLKNETKFVIRGRNDYAKLLLLSNPDFIASGGRDTAIAAVVEIFALKNDLSVLSFAEKQAFQDSIALQRQFGVQPPIIIESEPNFMDVTVTLTLDITVGDTNALVRGILASFEKKLSTPEEEQFVDFVDIEKQMTESDLVKISRIVIKFSTWAASSLYRRGIHVEPIVPNGFIYEVLEFNRFSGSVEPTWPAPIPPVPPATIPTFGQTVVDNSIVWESIAKDITLTDWSADSVYKVGDKIKHLENSGNDPDASFIVKQVLHKSGISTPATFASVIDQGATYTADVIGAIGNSIALIFDGVDDVDTVTSAWNLANPANTVSFSGVAGTFVPTSNTTSLVNGVDAFDAEPIWDVPVDALVPDDRSFENDRQIVWLMIKKFGTPAAWVSDTVYSLGDSVIPTNVLAGQENMMWQMVSTTGSADIAEPTFPIVFGNTVIDNEITWITRDKLASPEVPRTNEYYLITEDVTVV